jgi:hypothetical protein
MLDVVMRFTIGFGLSLGLGWLITMIVHDYFNYRLKERVSADGCCGSNAEAVRNPDVPPGDAFLFGSHMPVPGCIERSVFTILVACNVSGAAIAMIGWLGLKTAIVGCDNIKTIPGKIYAFHVLFTGMVSLFFALLGGLFIRGGII